MSKVYSRNDVSTAFSIEERYLSVLGRLRDLQYRFAVIYETLCSTREAHVGLYNSKISLLFVELRGIGGIIPPPLANILDTSVQPDIYSISISFAFSAVDIFQR